MNNILGEFQSVKHEAESYFRTNAQNILMSTILEGLLMGPKSTKLSNMLNQFSLDTASDAVALSLENAIEHASGHNGKITVSRNTAVLTLTQATKGTDGNTTVTETLSNCTATSFTGGTPGTGVSIDGIHNGYEASAWLQVNGQGSWQGSANTIRANTSYVLKLNDQPNVQPFR